MTFDTPIPRLRAIDTVPFQQDGRDYLLLRDPHGISDQQIAVAIQALPILARLDGRHSVREISQLVRREHHLEVTDQQVHEIASMLEQARLLLSEDFLVHRQQVEAEFREQTVREPILIDGGYPPDPDDLRAFLTELEAAPPADDFAADDPVPDRPLRGWLVPHIDYHRGGASYGRLYRQVRDRLPDPSEGPLLVGVIGVAHAGAFEPAVTTAKDFRTPLGQLRHDAAAIAKLREHLGDAILREELVHKAEHSVEIQLPWLQHLLGDRDDVTLLPLLAGVMDPTGGDNGRARDAGKVRDTIAALREVEQAHPGPVLWVASVDFAHVGPSFGDPAPVSDRDRSIVERRDMKALETLRSLDAAAWWATLDEDGNARRVCGMGATYLTLSLLAGCEGRILDYQQALDDDRSTLVSHAAAIFQG